MYYKDKIQDNRLQLVQARSLIVSLVNLKKLKSCIMYLLQIASNPRIVSDPGFKQVVDRLGLSSLVSESSEKFKAVCKLTNELVSKGEKVLIWTNFGKMLALGPPEFCKNPKK